MKHNVSHMPLKSELLLLSQKINFKEDYNEKHKNQCENRLGKQVFEFVLCTRFFNTWVFFHKNSRNHRRAGERGDPFLPHFSN